MSCRALVVSRFFQKSLCVLYKEGRNPQLSIQPWGSDPVEERGGQTLEGASQRYSTAMAEEAAAPAVAAGTEAAPPPGKMTMVVGVDESEHSFYALQWALQHFFPPPPQPQQYRLVVVTAKPSAASAVGLAGPGYNLHLHLHPIHVPWLVSHDSAEASDISDDSLIDGLGSVRFIQAPRMCCRTWRRTSRKPPCASSTKPKHSAHRSNPIP